MFTRPAVRLCRECAHTLRFSQRRPLSSAISQTTRQIPKRPFPNFRPQNGPSIQAHQRRNAASLAQNAKTLWRQYPFSVSLATVIILFGMGSLAYVNYVYQSYIIGAFHNYPEEVAKKLRRALYYTNSDLQPKEATKYYKQALEVAAELGMDPFSDEILGIKIQVAGLMERIQNFPKAISVLEIVRRDCLKWEEELGNLERNKEKRTRVLAKTVAISVKLGELYSNPYIHEESLAEERLVWAVETVLKEKLRREAQNVNDADEGSWISDDELGASLEALAHNYEGKNKHYLATPLFLQALSLKRTEDCHSVVLMNNLATALAQQTPPRESGTAPASRAALVESAKSWAQKALDVAAGIAPPNRTEECDVGCAVAVHNLGEFAEMNGDFAEARRRYKEAGSLAKAVGFGDGARMSREGMQRVGDKVD